MFARVEQEEQADPMRERRGEPARRSCIIVAEAGADRAALESAVAPFASHVEVAAPVSFGGQLWRSSGPRVLIARGEESVVAVIPWMPLLQSAPSTGSIALIDGTEAKVRAILERFDFWLPACTPAAIVAAQVVAQWSFMERQARLNGPRRIVGNNLIVDLGREEAFNADDERIPLTASEFRLMAAMAVQPGRVVDFWQLGASLPGQFRNAEDAYNSVKVHVGRLRQKLLRGTGWDGHLVSVRGRGFLFERRAPRDPIEAQESQIEPSPCEGDLPLSVPGLEQSRTA